MIKTHRYTEDFKASTSYDEFISNKNIRACSQGFEPIESLYPKAIKKFQKAITKLSCHRGRSAIFAATGLGKTIDELSFARQVVNHTQGECILFAPLAVAEQIVNVEAKKFGFAKEVTYAKNSKDMKTAITVTNYERRNSFDLSEVAGVILDESGILKNVDGQIRQELTEACSAVPYHLLCSATPAPNDWTELGQHSEFLGVLTQKEMLATFFVHEGSLRAGIDDEWRLKKHAENLFWAWVASWAVVINHPRDIGFEEDGYDLPPLHVKQITVKSNHKQKHGFFIVPAKTLIEQNEASRESVKQRVQAAADLVKANPDETWLIWCHLNLEAEALTALIPEAVNVTGSNSQEYKTEKLLGFAENNPRVLVTKPSIAGRGMNWQNCHNMIFVGLNNSFEQLFQAIRRCWRFGQMLEVNVYLIASDREGAVVDNLKAKELKYDQMAKAMQIHMKDLLIAYLKDKPQIIDYNPTVEMKVPQWLGK